MTDCKRHRPAAACTWLLVAALANACAAPLNGARNQFGVSTSAGIVVADVAGAATGLTNQDLTRLVRAGVGQSYPVACGLPADITAHAPLMFWRVTSDGRHPTAVVRVDLVRDGQTVRTAVVSAAAPGSNPDSVFLREVAALARRVLPPPTTAPVTAPLHC